MPSPHFAYLCPLPVMCTNNTTYVPSSPYPISSAHPCSAICPVYPSPSTLFSLPPTMCAYVLIPSCLHLTHHACVHMSPPCSEYPSPYSVLCNSTQSPSCVPLPYSHCSYLCNSTFVPLNQPVLLTSATYQFFEHPPSSPYLLHLPQYRPV